jgi:hypothetical protein
MEKKNIIIQAYGYIICLVAVITFLISVTALVNAVIDKSDPLRAGRGWPSASSPNLASFENYKMDIIRSIPKDAGTVAQNNIPDDQTLRTMYEAAKNEVIQTALFRARQQMITCLLIIVICVVLFITHWRWMQKLARVVSQ